MLFSSAVVVLILSSSSDNLIAAAVSGCSCYWYGGTYFVILKYILEFLKSCNKNSLLIHVTNKWVSIVLGNLLFLCEVLCLLCNCTQCIAQVFLHSFLIHLPKLWRQSEANTGLFTFLLPCILTSWMLIALLLIYRSVGNDRITHTAFTWPFSLMKIRIWGREIGHCPPKPSL